MSLRSTKQPRDAAAFPLCVRLHQSLLLRLLPDAILFLRGPRWHPHGPQWHPRRPEWEVDLRVGVRAVEAAGAVDVALEPLDPRCLRVRWDRRIRLLQGAADGHTDHPDEHLDLV